MEMSSWMMHLALQQEASPHLHTCNEVPLIMMMMILMMTYHHKTGMLKKLGLCLPGQDVQAVVVRAPIAAGGLRPLSVSLPLPLLHFHCRLRRSSRSSSRL